MHIRNATEKDVPAIIRLLANDTLGQLREDFQDPLPRHYYEAFFRIQQDAGQELIVVEDAGTVIGTLQLSFIPGLTYQGGIRAQIEAVRIHEGYRHRGTGQHMIEWAIQRARQRGAHMVQLTSDKQRDDAIRFYERLGFKASHIGLKLLIR